MSTNLSQPWLRLPGGARHDITGACTIGRVPGNTITFADTEVSRRHAIIHPQDQLACWLVDLGSANGTFLNGRRITQAMPLHHGDLIRIGSHELAFSPRAPGSVSQDPTRPLTSEQPPLRLAQCWLMVADIIGITQLAQSLSVPDLSHMIGGWFKNCRQFIDECGGRIARYSADGFFACWENSDDSVIQIRQTVASMYEAQQASTPPFRLSLHFGPAEIGTIPMLTEPSFSGPEIDFVFAMQPVAAAQQQNILFSEAAVRRLSADAEVRQVCECPVPGFTKPGKFYTPSY